MSRKGKVHTQFRPGKRVHVKLLNGDCFVDKFVELSSQGLHFEQHGIVRTKDIRSTTIWRQRP